MNATDPMIPIYFVACCATGWLGGYLAAYLRSRALIRRYERSYGSLITRSR